MIVTAGRISMTFRPYPDQDDEVTHIFEAGEFGLWEPGILHYWEALEDSHTINVEWPASTETSPR